MTCDEAIILAGGAGTRLRSVVSDVPKPLAPVAGRPFIAWLLDHLSRQGLRRVILATGYRADQVEATLGRRWGALDVAYVREDQPLGTGGAIRRASALLSDARAHVLNGDTYLEYSPASLEAFTERQEAEMGVALARVSDVSRYGAVEVANCRITGFREKGSVGEGLINAGSYYLTADALRNLPEEQVFSFEREVLEPRARDGRVAGFDETARFIDIGVPEDFLAAQAHFRIP